MTQSELRKRRDKVSLVAVCLLFLLIQIVLIASVEIAEYDEAVFLDVARNIVRSGQPLRSIGSSGEPYFVHTPLYPYLLAGFMALLGDNLLLLRLVTVVFGLGVVILTYLIVRLSQGVVAATAAAAIVALNSFFAVHSFFITMEVPMAFFLLAAAYLLFRDASEAREAYLVSAGLAIAVAVLLKEIALIFAVVAVFYALLGGSNWRQRLARAFWISLPSLLGLTAWAMWAYQLAPEQYLAAVNRWWNAAAGVGWDSRLGVSLTAWLGTVGGEIFSWSLVLLLVVGGISAFMTGRQLPQGSMLIIAYLVVAVVISMLVSLKEPRHLMALIPAAAIAVGILVDWDSLLASVKRNRIGVALAAAMIPLFAWDMSPATFPSADTWRSRVGWLDSKFSYRSLQSDAYLGVVRKSGQYLAEHSPPETVIAVMHEGPVTGYYADRSHYFLYVMGYERTLEVLEKTDFLLVDHVVFPSQTKEEIATVLAYVDEHFVAEQTIEDSGRQAIIYRRRAP